MNKLHTLKSQAMKSTTLLVVFLFAFVFGTSAQEAELLEKVETVSEPIKVDQKTGKKYFDNTYIKVELTGNKAADDQAVLAAKENLAKSNPALYRKMIMSYPVVNALEIADKSNLPAANPELNKKMNKDNKLLITPVDEKSVLPAANSELKKAAAPSVEKSVLPASKK